MDSDVCSTAGESRRDAVDESASLKPAHRLRLGVKVAGLALADIDYKSGVNHLSAEAARLFGFGEKAVAVPRERVHATFHPDDRDELELRISEAMDPTGDGTFDMEHRVVLPDRTVRWLSVRKQVVFGQVRGARRPVSGVLAAIDITARRAAEHDLRDSERRLRLALEASDTGMWNWDMRTDAVTWSPECYRIHGVKEGAFAGTGEAFFNLVHPEDRDRVSQAVRGAAERRELYECEFRIVRPDGQVAWVANRGRASYDAGGRPVSLLGTITDVTTRHAAEEQLRTSEAFNRSLMDGTADCVKVLDLDGHLLLMNAPGMCQMEIDDFAPLCGSAWSSLWPDGTRQKVAEAVAAARAGEARRFDALCPTAKGKPRYWEVVVSPVRDASGAVVRLLAVSRDVTDRRHAEEELRQAQSRFRTMADGLPFPVWVHGPKATLTMVNRTYCEYFGVTEKQVLGEGWRPLVHPDDAPEYVASFLDATRRGQPWQMRCRVRQAGCDEWRWISSASRPQFSESGEYLGVVGCSPDITDQVMAEEALRDSDRHKDQFLATLAHELRNPLAAIRGSVELLQLNGDAAAEALVDVVDRQSRLLGRLVDDLLDVGRINTGKIVLRRGRVDVAAAVRQAAETIRPACEASGHKLTVQLPDESSSTIVDGDEARIIQIVSNLLNNACKFTPAGGQITVTVSHEADAHGRPARVRVVVRDNGIGIDPADLGKVFNLFSQLHLQNGRQQAGLGIGLSLVRYLADLHGGTVEACSPGKGHGSEFVVRLPLEEAVRV